MQQVQYVKIGNIISNPNNPRIVKDAKFEKLVQSLNDFPEMLEKRPLICVTTASGKFMVLGGNQRLKAAQKANIKQLPVLLADEWSEAQRNEFIVKDNIGYGDWDWQLLETQWNADELIEWGLELPDNEQPFDKGGLNEFQGTEEEDFFVPDCIYNSNNIYDIPTLRVELQAKELMLPFKPYGAEKRTNGGVGTYHFYVDDYRFEAIWKNPVNILKSGCTQIVEPNLSLYDTTPISYGLFLIYKKRWISRFFQEKGIRVYADLNVSDKFINYNVMGIPDGYNSFCTRGYTERLEYLKKELHIAQKISGLKEPNLLVYGGGKEIKEFCAENNLTFVKDFVNSK